MKAQILFEAVINLAIAAAFAALLAGVAFGEVQINASNGAALANSLVNPSAALNSSIAALHGFGIMER